MTVHKRLVLWFWGLRWLSSVRVADFNMRVDVNSKKNKRRSDIFHSSWKIENQSHVNMIATEAYKGESFLTFDFYLNSKLRWWFVQHSFNDRLIIISSFFLSLSLSFWWYDDRLKSTARKEACMFCFGRTTTYPLLAKCQSESAAGAFQEAPQKNLWSPQG